jgi:predicted DNA-binding WGR domain protein
LTCKSGGSNKFYYILQHATRHVIRFGRIGSDGQVQTRDFDTESEAIEQYERIISDKKRKSYKVAALPKSFFVGFDQGNPDLVASTSQPAASLEFHINNKAGLVVMTVLTDADINLSVVLLTS